VLCQRTFSSVFRAVCVNKLHEKLDCAVCLQKLHSFNLQCVGPFRAVEVSALCPGERVPSIRGVVGWLDPTAGL
jgi:hypothetical protein